MSTILDRFQEKPEQKAKARIPSVQLKGMTAIQWQVLLRKTGLSGTRLVTEIIQHVLSSDTGLKKLLSE